MELITPSPTLPSTLSWKVTSAVSRPGAGAGGEKSAVSGITKCELQHLLCDFTDGILYGVCQYSVDLTRVLSQPRVEITPGHKSLHLSMTTCDTCPGWRPTRVSLSACLKRSLEDDSEYLASREKCVEAETIVSSWSSDVIMIGNLSMFAEYEIEIDFNLEFFNATSLYRVQGRTSKFYRWLVNLSDRCTTTFRFNNI